MNVVGVHINSHLHTTGTQITMCSIK